MTSSAAKGPKFGGRTAAEGQGEAQAEVLKDQLLAVLHPVIDTCLKAAISGPKLLERVRRCIIKRAFEQLPRHPRSGRAPTVNRVALTLGFPRTVVKQAVAGLIESSLRDGDSVDRLIDGWRTDPRFQSKSGRPAPLTFKVAEGRLRFEDLVGAYVPSRHPGSLLHELVRRGRADRDAWGRVRLKGSAARPSPA